jgi:type VI secretion system protein ImpC
MSGQVSFGRLASQHSDGGGGSGAFRILVMGDFSARAGRGVREGLAGRKRIGVDVDNWERVLGSLGAEVRIPAGEGEIVFAPKEIDDFHPDWLYSKLDVFRALRDLRQRMMDSSTFNAAADEVRSWAADSTHGQVLGTPNGDAHATPAGQAQGEPIRQAQGEVDLLGRLLGQRPAGADAPASGAPKGAPRAGGASGRTAAGAAD